MADFKQNYFQRRTKDRGPRSNNRISSPEVQVIASNGENLGIISTNEAISIAKNQNLDLIEIAPNASPPVCKIMDMGKFKYDAQKKANLAKKKQKIVSLKEIIFCFFFARFAFFLASYLNFPISIILQTGGFALGAISIKSSP